MQLISDLGEILNEKEFRARFQQGDPIVFFPKVITPESLVGYGWSIYTPPVQPPTPEEIIADLTSALESYYDMKASEKRYDNRYTCALRAGYQGPFQSEGIAFAQWMDTCNAYGYQVMTDCQNGLRPIPTAEQLISELPELTWPE